jgi:hypothetical protein
MKRHLSMALAMASMAACRSAGSGIKKSAHGIGHGVKEGASYGH